MVQIQVVNKKGRKINIEKRETDPMAMRLSIGGKPGVGYYCTFRAESMDQAEEMLEEVLEAFKIANEQWKQQMN